MFSKRFATVLFVIIFSFSASAQVLTLDFVLKDSKFILLKLPVENSADSLTVFFDTGATNSLIDTSVAKKYGLKSNYSQKVAGAGGEKTYEILTGHTLKLSDNISINGVNLIFEDITRLRSTLGENFDMIVGNDILKNYLTEISFKERKIRLYPFGTEVKKVGFTKIDFEFGNGIAIPQFPVQIRTENGETFQDTVLFDSGAGLSLLINTPFNQTHDVVSKMGKTTSNTLNNLSKKSVSTDGILENISFSKFSFNRVPVTVSSDTEGVSGYKGYLGILGAVIINRFDIILDYQKKELYLKPNYLFNDGFELPNPVKLIRSEEKVIISEVNPESVAYRKGLRSGQEIISVNNTQSSDIFFYRNALRQYGKKVKLKIADPDGSVRTVKFKPQSLLK